jgi:hypothetical protein
VKVSVDYIILIKFDCLQVFSVEVSPESSTLIQPFMLSKGYKLVTHIRNAYAHDDIYLHGSLDGKLGNRVGRKKRNSLDDAYGPP